jgi:tetratricopeptide (TPR) repeat protein
VSSFHEPEPAVSLLDPWWLAALPAGAFLVWRISSAFRSRSEEAAYWVAAAAAFAPVSQLFPFLIPVADRYLYFILPGLIGAALFLFVALRERLPAGASVSRGAAVIAVGVALFFAWNSAARAKLWTNETLLFLDAARHYPDGATAAFLSARRLAQQGDAAAAVAALRRAADRGIDQFMAVREDPGFAPIRETEEFRGLIREMAGRWIERALQREDPTAPELRAMAQAHLVREEYAEAEASLERALAAGGPFAPSVRADLTDLRARHPELLRAIHSGGEDAGADFEAGDAEEGEHHRPQ